jgi:hypothetical protein
MITDKESVVFDTELIGSPQGPVTFLFCATHVPSGKSMSLWGDRPADMDKLALLLNNPHYLWVSMNGMKFDAPVIAAVLTGRPLTEVKRMANRLITEGIPPWQIYRDYSLEPLEIDHVDLFEVAPGVMVSLKTYQARMKMKTIRDLPFEHDATLTSDDLAVLEEYCQNDVAATALMFKTLDEALTLREHMTDQYGIDVRSKSDAQMAETIIAKSLGIMRAGPVDVPASVRYRAPDFVQPRGAVMRDILARVEQQVFKIDQRNGAVILPEFLAKEQVKIGNGTYQMGIGGLHSTHDKCVAYRAGDDFLIRDADVGSFYPNIAVNAGMAPRGLGESFITLYRRLLKQRMDAKHAGDKVVANSLKIALNGTFGKLGSMFSKIYSPDLMLAITLTGQLYLLTLIEDLVALGVEIISANTDGVCFCGTAAQVHAAEAWIECYGFLTGFEFEFTEYRRIGICNVNNYCAITTDGKIKTKGRYALCKDTPNGLMKNPTNEVCTLAAQAYLATGRSIDSFIREHLTVENFCDFTQARSVKGGGVQFAESKLVDDWFEVTPGEWNRPGRNAANIKRKSRPKPVEIGINPTYLGRTVRWYYSTDKSLSINYASNGNLVPKSEGGRACMTLPDTIPADLDIHAYVAETTLNLINMGINNERVSAL